MQPAPKVKRVTVDPADEIDIAASYSRRDAASVIPLLDALKARGVKVWFDKNIPGGALWEETITRFMRRAKAVVFFASRASLESDRCFDEVSAARTLKRPIIPVLVEHVNIPDDLPDRLVLTLQTRNTIEAWPGADGDPVEALMRALAGFGVYGAAVAAPTEAVSNPSPPAPPPLVVAPSAADAPPPPRPRTGWPLYAAGGGLAVAAAAAALFFSGALGPAGASGELPTYTEAEWCSMAAPRLLDRATAAAGVAGMEKAAADGDPTALTLQCLSQNVACTSGGDSSRIAPAFAACEQAANKGNWRAVYNQGWLKQRGCGVPVDAQGAVAAYTRASDAGCAIAQFTLGKLYQDAELVGFDEAKSIKLLTDAANQNYPPAMNMLANAMALGRGVPEDDAKAADLYRRAADLGHPGAMFNYAHVLEIGIGVPKNTGAAIAYYRRAAEQNDDAEIKRDAETALKRLAATAS